MTDLGKLTGDYDIDTVQTRIGFVARHTMATRVRGRFEEFEGAVHLDGDQPSKSEVRLTIRTRSIQTRNPQRDDLLRAKFLGATDHPTVTFTSTRVEHTDGTRFEVTGDLGMRGLVRPVTVDVEVTGTEEGARVGFKGSATIDRNDWGVNWNAATKIMIQPEGDHRGGGRGDPAALTTSAFAWPAIQCGCPAGSRDHEALIAHGRGR